MERLVRGTRRFRTEVFPGMAALFDDLRQGQAPCTLFVTCADSRVDPSLITQSEPGTLFVLRNAGNVVPADGSGGEGATIEYAVEVLGVRHVIVCGHSGCGAMTALLEPGETAELPLVRDWLSHVGEVTEALVRSIETIGDRDLVEVAVGVNVRLQLRHLAQHPSVARAVAAGRLDLFGWVYDVGSGLVTAWDEAARRWVAVN
jgi:carbonic anhydrase